ncbi:MAG: HD domain-containing protein [Methyloceanibacter sp.]|uniref:HD domain-containing protein n=1 Tax=Methyloceanibacter sp. TaxID=1965321 RepID=UPI003D6CA6DC
MTGASANTALRAWQRMLSGRRLDLLDPSPLDIEIEDIAHGLARVARWNGQTSGDHTFSVADHSLLVEEIAADLDAKLPRQFRLAALLHDSPEYVIGDLISPFKAALSLDYRAFEAKLLAAIYLRFGLPPDLPEHVTKLIKRADKTAAYYEATGLAGFSRAEARRFFGQPRGLSPALVHRLSHLSPLPASEGEARFLKRFHALAR